MVNRPDDEEGDQGSDDPFGGLNLPLEQIFAQLGIPMPRRGEPLDMPQFVLRLVEAGRPVLTERFDGYWLDIGRHDDLARAQSEFDSMRPELLRERS